MNNITQNVERRARVLRPILSSTSALRAISIVCDRFVEPIDLSSFALPSLKGP